MKYRLFYMQPLKTHLALLFAAMLFAGTAKGRVVTENLRYKTAIKQFYGTAARPFWFSNNTEAPVLRQSLIELVDTCSKYGLFETNYHPAFLKRFGGKLSKADSASLSAIDEVFTDAAIGICRDIYVGDITGFLSYDEISPKYEAANMAFITARLSYINGAPSFKAFVNSLEPANGRYLAVKKNLAVAIHANAAVNIKKLSSEVNYLRWLWRLNLKTFALVNIPSATLDFYRNDTAMLSMKAVVGKPSTHTPRMAAYCNQVILYPYWNVPSKIGLYELLPKFKRSPALVDGMNMQVIDGNGRVINHHNLDWSKYNAGNFPYSFRQSTGCDNALGVIKFNLSDPFSVYMHDTNLKLAFLSPSRYLSHGCIRLEKPEELANLILPQKIDSTFIASCIKGQKPVVLELPQPVPVLVVYLVTSPGDETYGAFYKDIYTFFK